MGSGCVSRIFAAPRSESSATRKGPAAPRNRSSAPRNEPPFRGASDPLCRMSRPLRGASHSFLGTSRSLCGMLPRSAEWAVRSGERATCVSKRKAEQERPPSSPTRYVVCQRARRLRSTMDASASNWRSRRGQASAKYSLESTVVLTLHGSVCMISLRRERMKRLLAQVRPEEWRSLTTEPQARGSGAPLPCSTFIQGPASGHGWPCLFLVEPLESGSCGSLCV